MSLIEEQFVFKTAGKEKYRILVSYWDCVKIQIPKVLSCVSQVFPHYTNHDISHSNAILDNIERILGKNAILNLSVTDLWLLLCSVYCHDIGMYITGDEIQECFEAEDFQKFVQEKKNDTKSPLNKYAMFYNIEKGKLQYSKSKLSLDTYHSARYLLAEYFRKKHAERSQKILDSNISMPQIYSEIKRLIKIIGKICYLHGADFEEVKEFQNYEIGVDGLKDYCHPRFVACMLRLGDLLDFDSSRVSYFLLEHLSSSIPFDSKIHNEKNFSITHVTIDSKKVEVVAECEDVDVAFNIDEWFSWIREEMSNQRNYWPDITPSSDIKGFPMLGKLETKLKGYETIDNNFKPKFEIDSNKAVEILQGSGLYDRNSQCIREILQNAIDATYIRIYLENKEKFEGKTIDDGFKEFIDLCKLEKYQIEIECKEDNGVWHFVIKDHGIGMRKDDLKYLLKIGSGENNKEKFDIINQMPVYARPSGIFGIGFQSIFLITNKVEIETRRTIYDDLIKMEIGTPIKGGFAIIKKEKNTTNDVGTTISFDITGKTINFELRNIISKYRVYYGFLGKSFDFFENQKCDIEIAKILSEVDSIADRAYLKIKCQSKKIKEEKRIIRSENKKIYHYNDGKFELIVELSLLTSFYQTDYFYGVTRLLYRNEYVRDQGLSKVIKFINLDVNVLSGRSDELLSVSRNQLRLEYLKILKRPLINLILQYLESIKDSENITENDKVKAALFIEYYGEKDTFSELKELWSKIKIFDISFNEYQEYELISFSIDNYFRIDSDTESGSYIAKRIEKIDNPKQLIIYNINDEKCQFLGYFLYKHCGYRMRFESFEDVRSKRMVFKKNSKDSVDWKAWLECYKKRYYRSLMPCFGYEKLQVNESAFEMDDLDPMHVFEKISYPRTVCPYVVKDDKLEWDCSEKVIEWVYKNKTDDTVLREDIESEFNKMRNELSDIVKKINDEVDKKKAKADNS